MKAHTMTTATHPLPPCDCLDWCGDDQRRLAQGVVQPCAKFRERKLAAEREQLKYRLLHELSHGVDVLAALQELQAMHGQRKVIAPLLRELVAALATVEPEDTAEADLLAQLLQSTRAVLVGIEGQAVASLFSGGRG